MSFNLTAFELAPAYVIDTHALLWHLSDNKKLGNQAKQILDLAEEGQTRIIVSAIVLAELYYSHHKHNFSPKMPQIYANLQSHPAYELVPFLPIDVLDFTLDDQVPEMHDRIIVGLARRLSVPLITRDPLIIAANLVQTVW